MDENKVILNQNKDGKGNIEIDIPSIGAGRMRTSGAWMLLMLAAETRSMRPMIILEVMKRLEIRISDLQEVLDDKPCENCGVSLLAHSNGNCQ